MENLPVEIIGNILSRIEAARDVVIAYTTCKNWQVAWREHVHALSFDSNDWPKYHNLTTRQLEILITETILQTRGLQSLSISMEDVVNKFSAAPVIAWLMHTRDTLRRLCYNVGTEPSINILEKCGRQKLEVLVLGHASISGVKPSYHRFPCLKSLSLTHVSISPLDLGLLLMVCPIIETLTLISPEDAYAMSDSFANMTLSSSSLKHIHIETVRLGTCILEADNLETLSLSDCFFEVFKLIGKGNLRVLNTEVVGVHRQFDIGDNLENLENLKLVEVDFPITWPKLYEMILNSSNLRELSMSGPMFEDATVIDLQIIAVRLPQLTHLSLFSYTLGQFLVVQGSSLLENMAVLKLGWTGPGGIFPDLVAELLKRCPNLKKLVVYSDSEEDPPVADWIRWNHSLIAQLMQRRYKGVDLQFEHFIQL